MGSVLSERDGATQLPAHYLDLRAARAIPRGNSLFRTVIRRYDADGNLDTAFGSGGEVVTAQPEAPLSAAIQSDGSILVGGRSRNGSSGYPAAMARVLTDGTPDPAFGTGGIVVTGAGPGAGSLIPYALVLVAGDDIVAGGGDGTSLYNDNHFVLARYHHTDGSIEEAGDVRLVAGQVGLPKSVDATTPLLFHVHLIFGVE